MQKTYGQTWNAQFRLRIFRLDKESLGAALRRAPQWSAHVDALVVKSEGSGPEEVHYMSDYIYVFVYLLMFLCCVYA